MKTEEKLKEKQKYFAEKMIDGARALYNLFEWLKDNRVLLTDEIASKIASNYKLTQNQKKYFLGTVERAKRAQGAVKYLENRFGVDENLNFHDSEGLHKLLFRGVYCPKEIKARSYNIGIGFIRKNWRYEDCAGLSKIGFSYDQLNVPLHQTIDRLEDGKLTNVAGLCFTLPKEEYFKKTVEKLRKGLREEEKIWFTIFGPSAEQEAEKFYKTVQEHELRHVIDIILPKRGGYSETQADLYAEENFGGLNEDLKEDNKRIGKNINKLAEELKEYRSEGLKTMVENTEERYNKNLQRKENLDKGVEILKNLVKKIPKQDYKMLSYLFSTLPWVCSNNSLSHLKALNEYYGEV